MSTDNANSVGDRTPTGDIKPPATEQTPQTPQTDQTQKEIKGDTSTTQNQSPEPPKGDKPEGDKTLINKDAKETKPEGAPEKYEAFTVPDGFELDEAVATEAGTLFKKFNLPQAAAQELVDFYVAKTQAAADAPFKLWQDTQDQWVDTVKKDPEIGSVDGLKPAVKERISRAIDSLGPELAAGFREAMDFTGAGNNPAFIKAFNAMAQRMVEGKHVNGKGPAKTGQQRPDEPRTAAQAMFPNLPSARG